jgi:hypothetical protein
MVVITDGDSGLLSDRDLQDLLDLHAVSADEALLRFGDPSHSWQGEEKEGIVGKKQHARAPMVTHAAEFNSAVYRWIESVT